MSRCTRTDDGDRLRGKRGILVVVEPAWGEIEEVLQESGERRAVHRSPDDEAVGSDEPRRDLGKLRLTENDPGAATAGPTVTTRGCLVRPRSNGVAECIRDHLRGGDDPPLASSS
jgi:hypothetical protein